MAFCHVRHKEQLLGCLLSKVVWQSILLRFGLERRQEKGSGGRACEQGVSGSQGLTTECFVMNGDESPLVQEIQKNSH